MEEENVTLSLLKEIVSQLNAEIYEQTEGMEYIGVVLHTDGCIHWVEFLGLPIWDSDNDEREYLDGVDGEETEQRELINDCIRRLINVELDKIKKMSF